MVSDGALACAAVAITLLLFSGIWAEIRWRRFETLPAHFNASGRPTRYGSRSFVIWLMPLLSSAILLALILGMEHIPPQYINGDASIGVILASGIFVVAHAFVLWMIDRWADGRSANR